MTDNNTLNTIAAAKKAWVLKTALIKQIEMIEPRTLTEAENKEYALYDAEQCAKAAYDVMTDALKEKHTTMHRAVFRDNAPFSAHVTMTEIKEPLILLGRVKTTYTVETNSYYAQFDTEQDALACYTAKVTAKLKSLTDQ